MNNGKHICKKLKSIRKQIAKANDIDYKPNICTHEGECAGTCPACEEETQYIESQLIKRRKLGKAVSVVGISTSLALGIAAGGLTSCSPLLKGRNVNGKMEKMYPLEGDVMAPEPDSTTISPYIEEKTDSVDASSQPDNSTVKTYMMMPEEAE